MLRGGGGVAAATWRITTCMASCLEEKKMLENVVKSNFLFLFFHEFAIKNKRNLFHKF